MEENKSEVARILQQIRDEYSSAYQALHGIAHGNSRHAFISARYTRMGELQQALELHMPEDEAWMLFNQIGNEQQLQD